MNVIFLLLSSGSASNHGKCKDTNLRSHGVPFFLAIGVESAVEEVREDVEADVHGADGNELLVATLVEGLIVGTINIGLVCAAFSSLLRESNNGTHT